MTQRIELRGSNGVEVTASFPDRLVRSIIPQLAMLEGLIGQHSGFELRFIPPLRVENEATGQHFWLGRPPITPRTIPPILIAALGAAIEEGYI